MTTDDLMVPPHLRTDPWWHRAPGLVMHIPLIGSLLAVLAADSVVGLHWRLIVIGAMSGLSFALIWFVHLLVWGLGPRHGDARRWLIAPAMVGATLLLLAVHAPLRARFEISRGSFEDIVAAVEARDYGFCQYNYEPEWDDECRARDDVGTFAVDRVLEVPGGLLLESPLGMVVRTGGFAHFDDPPPDDLETDTMIDFEFHGLGDDWYWFTATDRVYTF